MDTEKETSSQIKEKNFFIYKGRFKSNAYSLYGLFLIIFNNRREMDTYNIVVSTYSNAYELEPHINWEKYEEKILNLKWKGNYNTSLSASLMDQLNKISEERTIKNQLYDCIIEYNHDEADAMFYDIFNRIIHDNNFILETGIQEITPEEFREIRERKIKSDTSKDIKEPKASVEGGVTLEIESILSPVKGKPLYELKIGDIIMAKIKPNTDRSNYFIDLLELRIENHIKPVPCEIIDLKSESKTDPLEILTQIAPGIYGKCIEDERQVKLRLYDPKTDQPPTKVKPSPEATVRSLLNDDLVLEEKGLSKTSFLLIGLFLLILIIFIMLVYISL